MTRYAIINTSTSKVENVVDYASAPSNPPPGFGQNYIAVLGAAANPGDAWNGTSIVPQSQPTPIVIPSRPTPRAWLERLAPATENAIFAAALSNAAILQWLFKGAGNPSIDVTAPETVAGVAALVSAGLITTAEQATLLAL